MDGRGERHSPGNGWVVSNKRPSITQGTQDTHVARAPPLDPHQPLSSSFPPPLCPPHPPPLAVLTMQSRNKFESAQKYRRSKLDFII